jgi:hypothetical protein
MLSNREHYQNGSDQGGLASQSRAVKAWSATLPPTRRNAATVIAQNLRLARRYPNAGGLPSVLALQIERMGGARG